jgi:hypothetical protein
MIGEQEDKFNKTIEINLKLQKHLNEMKELIKELETTYFRMCEENYPIEKIEFVKMEIGYWRNKIEKLNKD